MFLGTVPKELVAHLVRVVSEWESPAIQVLCSGNFTFERALYQAGVGPLYGNDVSLYSCALGSILAGNPLRVRIKSPDFEWLQPYMGDPLSSSVCVLLASRLPAHTKNAHYERLMKLWQAQWPDMHARMLDKYRALDPILAGFRPQDCTEVLADVPDDWGIVSYPPTYSGGYERMWRKLDDIFAWDQPHYDKMTVNGALAFARTIAARRYYYVVTAEPLPDLEPSWVGYVYKRGHKECFAYSNHSEPTAFVARAPKYNGVLLQTDTPGLSVAEISEKCFETLRAMYLSPRIEPAKAQWPFAVFLDGRLIGVFAMTVTAARRNTYRPYLMCDFATDTTLSRASKLVVMTAISREVQQILARKTGLWFKSCLTTAFTDKPVSMKYRGVMNLVKRILDKDGKQVGLNYKGEFGRWTLSEALDIWRKSSK